MKISKSNLFTQLIVLVLLVLSISSAQARDLSWRANSYSNSPVKIDVVDDRGRALNQYSANNRSYNKTQRTYLEAIKGKRYQLRIRNTSNKRIGVVVAVDGRNILNGKKSYLRNNEKMYVLDPYESANYKGWRTGNSQVNRFYFTSAGDSYSNAWGDRSAMGVIAVAVFDEKHKRYNKKYRNQLGKQLSPSRRSFQADESIGTGFGREEYSPTIRVNFKAKHQARYKYFLKYEWRKTLCKRGIVSCNNYENRRNHNRFWPRESDNEFAPYPPAYNRGWINEFTVRNHDDLFEW